MKITPVNRTCRLGLLVTVLLLAGCGPAAASHVASRATPTPLPTDTPAPTATPIPTACDAPRPLLTGRPLVLTGITSQTLYTVSCRAQGLYQTTTLATGADFVLTPGNRFVAYYRDVNTAVLRDVQSGTELTVAHYRFNDCISFSPDGQFASYPSGMA
jgi:hypothetical protein